MNRSAAHEWRLTTLGKLVDVLDYARVPVSAKEREKRPGRIPYFGAVGQVGWIDSALFDEELVLLGEDGVQFFDTSKTKAYRVDGPAWVNNHSHVLRARASDVSSRYLTHYLNQVDYRGFANGTTRLKLTQASMRRIPVRLPGLAGQRRIVEVLEDHLSRLDTAMQSLHNCKRRIRALERAHLDRLTHVGDWRAERLSSLAVKSDYGTSTKCIVGGAGIPVIRIPNVQQGRVDMLDEKRAEDPSVDLSSRMVKDGDLLVVRTNGSRHLIGRAAVAGRGLRSSFASYLIRFELDRSRISPEWALAVLRCSSVRSRIEEIAASSAGQYNLSLGKLGALEFPLPPLARQAELVKRLASLDAEIAAARRTVVDAEARGQSLRRAMLRAAFSGRLTDRPPERGAAPQDAGSKPA